MRRVFPLKKFVGVVEDAAVGLEDEFPKIGVAVVGGLLVAGGRQPPRSDGGGLSLFCAFHVETRNIAIEPARFTASSACLASGFTCFLP